MLWLNSMLLCIKTTFSLSIICCWTPRLIPYLGYGEQCCRKQRCGCPSDTDFLFFGYLHCSGTAGSHCNFICSFLRNLHTVCHSGCPSLLLLFLFFLFATESHCCPGWNTMVQSRLAHCSIRLPCSSGSHASAFWVGGITGARHCTWQIFVFFSRDGVSPRWPGWSWTRGLKWPAHLSRPTAPGLQVWSTAPS